MQQVILLGNGQPAPAHRAGLRPSITHTADTHSPLSPHAPLQVQCKLLAACILCFIFMIVEIVGGYMARR